MGHFFLRALWQGQKISGRFAHSGNNLAVLNMRLRNGSDYVGVICVDTVFCVSAFFVRSHADLSALLLCAHTRSTYRPMRRTTKVYTGEYKKRHTHECMKSATQERKNHFDWDRPNWIKHSAEARTSAKSKWKCVNSIVFGLSALVVAVNKK